MAAADLDAGYVAGYLGLDQPVLASLTTEPTVDLVAILLQAVTAKAHEFDTLYTDKLQTDIELENAVRISESRSQASKSTADKALKDVEEARQKLKEEGRCKFFFGEFSWFIAGHHLVQASMPCTLSGIVISPSMNT